MILKENAIRIIIKNRKKYGPRYTYIYKCSNENCISEINIRADALKSHSGYCIKHAHQKRPFESIYNGLFRDHRKTKVILSYEEFLEFTKISNCYYCGNKIFWNEYGIENGEFISRAYFLDRLDNNGPYSKNNCVVCCTKCNKFKKQLNSNEFIELCKIIAKKHI